MMNVVTRTVKRTLTMVMDLIAHYPHAASLRAVPLTLRTAA